MSPRAELSACLTFMKASYGVSLKMRPAVLGCRWGIACALLAGMASAAKALAGQFVYVYTRDKQSKDLKRITNFVVDK